MFHSFGMNAPSFKRSQCLFWITDGVSQKEGGRHLYVSLGGLRERKPRWGPEHQGGAAKPRHPDAPPRRGEASRSGRGARRKRSRLETLARERKVRGPGSNLGTQLYRSRPCASGRRPERPRPLGPIRSESSQETVSSEDRLGRSGGGSRVRPLRWPGWGPGPALPGRPLLRKMLGAGC